MVGAGLKPARKGVVLRHPPLRRKQYNFLVQKFPSPGGVPARAGWSRGRVGEITCPPRGEKTETPSQETAPPPEVTTPALCATPPPEGNNFPLVNYRLSQNAEASVK